MDRYVLEDRLPSWPVEDLRNLAAVLDIPTTDATLCDDVLAGIGRLYHSRTRAAVGTAAHRMFGKLSGAAAPLPSDAETTPVTPDYDELVAKLARKLGVWEAGVSLVELETYISHAVIVEALGKMRPKERVAFFASTIDAAEIARNTGLGRSALAGPLTTMGALGAAQLSGFGIYLASTTALGFATSAVGVTLPFAVYTGMTSTIAVVIGPAGWLAAGLWGAWIATQPEWRKLIPVALYIASARARHALLNPVERVA